jgi:hypothetical protein
VGLLELIDDAIGLDAIEAEMADNLEIAEAVMSKADEVREWWVSYWESFDHPHSRQHALKSGYIERPGDYAKGIKVKYLKTPEGAPMARITATDFKSAWIEYGSSKMPQFAPMAATRAHFGGSGRSISS